jgi:hypothetical protein
VRGTLNLPASLGFDHVLISDHFIPSDDGPESPEDVRDSLARGAITPTDVVSHLVEATAAAMSQVERSIIARPFSLLGRLAFDESLITPAQVQHFARRAQVTERPWK